jgi:hypothetical protein
MGSPKMTSIADSGADTFSSLARFFLKRNPPPALRTTANGGYKNMKILLGLTSSAQLPGGCARLGPHYIPARRRAYRRKHQAEARSAAAPCWAAIIFDFFFHHGNTIWFISGLYIQSFRSRIMRKYM